MTVPGPAPTEVAHANANANAAAAAAGRSPRSAAPAPPWFRALRYWMYQYKRTWRGSLTTSFLYPVLYLSAMGIGLGSLVNHHAHTVDGVRYIDFLAPGLLAGTAMQIGGNEAMYPVMGAIKWIRTYFAMLATPLGVVDVLVGHLAWIALRLTLVTTIYLEIMALFGTVHSPFALLAIPAGVLTGSAFSAPIAAFAATQVNDAGFSALYRFGLIPLFLFSGTFFPITQLPGWLQAVAEATPLYHGVALCRALTLGHLQPGPDIAHAVYLVVLTALGFALARRSFRRRLVT
jgi:lipooligosaccharide transport system permease protein